MLPGVRPSISFASLPTASTFFEPLPDRCTATTDGSFETIPLPRTNVSVFAVPKIDGEVVGEKAVDPVEQH